MKLKIDDIEIYYETHGEGDPIIFAHGWLTDINVWKSQIDYFSKNHKVIVYDQRGHGKSDKPDEGGYSILNMSYDIGSIIRKLGLDKVTLVGHSMGGMASMLFALNNPNKISRLVLVDTTAKMSFSARLFIWLMFNIFPYKTFIDGSINNLYYKPSEQVKKQALEIGLKVPKNIAAKYLSEFSKEFDIRDRLSEIKLPTLIIVGEDDKSTPVNDAKYLNNHIDGSILEVIPVSKHVPMIDRTDIFNDILNKFITK